MNIRGSVEWRVVWIILVIVAAAIIIVLSLSIYYQAIHQQSPFSYFSFIFGGS